MSPLTDPPFVGPSTGWTEEMEVAARRPRPPAPPPRRRWRLALRVSAWGIGAVFVLAGAVPLAFDAPLVADWRDGDVW